MDKFGFLRRSLRSKWRSIIKNKKFVSILGGSYEKEHEGEFKRDLQAATDSKHATDKILAMMGLRSMISKKNYDQPVYITFPVNEKDKQNIITKIKSFHGWNDVDTTIDNFIKSYNKLGKLAKAKILWVIAKMHNPKELATLAHDTKDRKKEVRAMLKFIQDNPIKQGTSYIQDKSSEDDAKPRIYTLNATNFKDVLGYYKISISEEFSDALDKYNGPKKDAFKRGLPAHGNEKIKAYNEALKKLMEEGTIDGNYPPEGIDPKDSGSKGIDSTAVIDYAEDKIKTEQADYEFIKSELDECLKDESKCDTAAKKLLDANCLQFDRGTVPTIDYIKTFISEIMVRIKDSKYDDCIRFYKQSGINILSNRGDGFIIYIEDKKELTQPILTQWHKFSGQISSITNSARLEQARKDTLKHEAFETLKDAFELLGKALDSKTGKEKADKLKAAKEAITGDIEVGSEKIAKSEIKKIFDEIVKILTPEEQWKEFCRYVSNINKSDTLKASIEHFLVDEAFEALKGAFDLLGKALDEKGEEKKTKLGDAKAAIPGDIKAGSKEIEKEEIAEIFDKIMKQKGPDVSSDTGTGKFPTGPSGLFTIQKKTKSSGKQKTKTPLTTETIKKAIELSEKSDRKGSDDNARIEWLNGIKPKTTPKTSRKQAETDRKQAETDRKQAETDRK